MVRPILALSVALASLCTTGCGVLIALNVGRERADARVFTHTDALADGHEIVFSQRKSDHAKATVVLVHGFGANRDHWTRFIGMLPDEIDAIAPDLPGFGESTKNDALSYDIDTQARRLHAFIAQRGLGRAHKYHLIGQSMGGHLAAHYALLYPDELESLVLFDPGGVYPSVAQKNGIPLVVRTEEDFDALLRGAFVTPPKVPGIVKGYFVEQAIANAEFARKVRADVDAKPQPMPDRIARLAPETLVVWGDTDKILDVSAAEVWRDRLAKGTVVVMKQTGHAPMLERPRESAALVITWWSQHHLVQ